MLTWCARAIFATEAGALLSASTLTTAFARGIRRALLQPVANPIHGRVGSACASSTTGMAPSLALLLRVKRRVVMFMNGSTRFAAPDLYLGRSPGTLGASANQIGGNRTKGHRMQAALWFCARRHKAVRKITRRLMNDKIVPVCAIVKPDGLGSLALTTVKMRHQV
eukprot:COSAG03_NODE_5_length_26473_cov_42.749526_2_plen_166_part_00